MAWTKVTPAMLLKVPDRYRVKRQEAALLRSWYCYECQDNFTVCILKYGKDVIVGVAKRNPRDRYNETIGRQVSWVSAYRNFVDSHGS